MLTYLAGLARTIASTAFTLFMAVVVLATLPFAGKDGRLFNSLCRFWGRGILRVCGVTLHVRGLEKLSYDSSYVYVSNHASMVDIPAIVAGLPDQVRILYKKELEKIPLFGWSLRVSPYIGLDRGRGPEAMRSLDDAASTIRNGASVILYAEGTRTFDGKLQPFKRGAFNLALRAGVPVVPLTLNGTFHILPRHTLCVRPGTVELVCETPILTAGLQGREAEVGLMEQVHTAIARNYIDQAADSHGSHPARR